MSIKLFVCADIFGVTPELTAAVQHFNMPYQLIGPASAGGGRNFADDASAYAAFVSDGGLPAYTERVRSAATRWQPSHLLGFSAGAAALWQLSAEAAPGVLQRPVTQAVLCYGGQIRQFTNLTPACPVHCLWSDESHFDVTALQQTLAGRCDKALFSQQHWPYPHGFVNPHSQHYQAPAARQFWQQLPALFKLE